MRSVRFTRPSCSRSPAPSAPAGATRGAMPFRCQYVCCLVAALCALGCASGFSNSDVSAARDSRNLGALVSALGDESPETRKEAETALIALGAEAGPELMRAVRDPDVTSNPSHLAEVAEVLAEVGDHAALEYLANASLTVNGNVTIVEQKADTSLAAAYRARNKYQLPPEIYRYSQFASRKHDLSDEEIDSIPPVAEMRRRFDARFLAGKSVRTKKMYELTSRNGFFEYTRAELEDRTAKLDSMIVPLWENHRDYQGGGLFAVDVEVTVPYSLDLSGYAKDRLAKNEPSPYAAMIQQSNSVPPPGPTGVFSKPGFYARLAVSAGSLYGTMAEPAGAKTRGWGIIPEAAIGGAFGPLAIGGMVQGQILVAPKAEVAGSETDLNHVYGFILLAPFVEFAPAVGRGLYAGFAAGVVAVAGPTADSSSSTGTKSTDKSAVGLGLLPSVGYDLKLSRKWHLGIGARLFYLTGARDYDGVKHTAFMPEAGLSMVYR
jgi:hypothetical protein